MIFAKEAIQNKVPNFGNKSKGFFPPPLNNNFEFRKNRKFLDPLPNPPKLGTTSTFTFVIYVTPCIVSLNGGCGNLSIIL